MQAAIIKRPYITEKTMKLASRGWYSFVVAGNANKVQIAQAIEKQYNVTVIGVRSIVMAGKTKRVGKKGKTVEKTFWKKAMVQLTKGQTIDAFQLGETTQA